MWSYVNSNGFQHFQATIKMTLTKMTLNIQRHSLTKCHKVPWPHTDVSSAAV